MRPSRPTLRNAALGAILLLALFWIYPDPDEGRGQRTLTPGTTAEAAPPPSPGLPASNSLEAADELAAELGRVMAAVPWGRSRWSVLALSLDQGDTLFAHDAREPLAPASNVKIITTAAALHYLGPSYRFPTFVLADGPLEDGVLRGDVVLYGTGDPAISDRFFRSKTAVLDDLAAVLAAGGIVRVQGDVVGDGTFFDGELLPPGWPSDDLNDWYGAPVSALSFNENVATLRIEAGPYAGVSPRIHTIPEEARHVLRFRNEATTVSGRAWPPVMVDRSVPTDPIAVFGEMRSGGRDAWRVITVDDPPLFAAAAFREALRRQGIAVTGPARAVPDRRASAVSGRTLWAPAFGAVGVSGLRLLATHQSPPLAELLEVLNERSHNLYAELVLKAVGQAGVGDGSLRGGVRAVNRYLTEVVGVDPGQVSLEDGSGLSPANRVSAAAFVQVMEHVATTSHWPEFWEALPEAGNRRELRRMWRTPAARNLRAKTGTIEGVSALSGVVRSRSGERILFSVLANDVPSTSAAKGIEDRIGTRLASFRRPFQRLPGAPATVAERLQERGDHDADFTGRHRVRSGENFGVIANRYGVSVEALLTANPGVSPRRLQVGQVLEVPGG